ncbi:acyltransferase [uncultured Erythrobacter sp.]|uniref:acyltransferase n=2 Tax=uncultured Erythrobacter sp. TaxID=263913 RepID=UPI00261B2880|nr:acyltransferase [uncultured Erythrobacter sp.]
MLARIRTQLYVARQVFYRTWLRRVWGMTIGEGVRISRKANLDYTHPKGVHIGEYTIVTPGVHIFTHDFVRRVHVSTYIGSNCFLGAGSIILPGVTIGDHCVIAAGSVVTADVPSRSVVGGNPAKVLKSNIKTGPYGIMGNLQPHELAVFEDDAQS